MSSSIRSQLPSNGSLKTWTLMTSPSIRRSSTRTEDESITLKEKACRPVCRRRQWVVKKRRNPLFAALQVTNQVTKFRDKILNTNRSGFFWTDTGSKSSLTVKRRFENTNSRLIMTEEVFKNWVKRSSRSRKNFIVFKQKNAVDKIINFFMNSRWSKTVVFVKLTRKVSMKLKNWKDFKVLHSTQLQEGDWWKIKILSLIGTHWQDTEIAK